ncbi:MAG: hypothetical protein HYW78_01425 [Parcubacteria group bacterium]|nr:hypothetical protein [Parcubacteria group bacterium]
MAYRDTIAVGDIVEMPNGVVGIVTHWEIVGFGHSMEVFVRPFTNWLYHAILFFTNKLWFYDAGIERLKVLHKVPRIHRSITLRIP